MAGAPDPNRQVPIVHSTRYNRLQNTTGRRAKQRLIWMCRDTDAGTHCIVQRHGTSQRAMSNKALA